MAVLPIKILNIAWCTAIQNNYLELPLKVKNYFFIEFLHESVRYVVQRSTPTKKKSGQKYCLGRKIYY